MLIGCQLLCLQWRSNLHFRWTQFVPHTLFRMYFIIIQSTSSRPIYLFTQSLSPLHQHFRNYLSPSGFPHYRNACYIPRPHCPPGTDDVISAFLLDRQYAMTFRVSQPVVLYPHRDFRTLPGKCRVSILIMPRRFHFRSCVIYTTKNVQQTKFPRS